MEITSSVCSGIRVQEALKHGARARRWFWRGWVCFNGGVREALKHRSRAQMWFWRGWVCFNEV